MNSVERAEILRFACPRGRRLAYDRGMGRSRLVAALLVTLAVVVHAPTLGHRFLLDDGVQIFKNHAVTAGAPLVAYFLDRDTTSSRADYNTRIYRPLRNIAFRGVVIIGGVRPVAFGIANIALYAASALLVLALLSRVIGDARAAAWATALWIVLPVHVEAVAYASALGDLLSLVLELAAIVIALPYIDGEPRHWRVAVSTALAAAAMLSKEMAVTLPPVLWLHIIQTISSTGFCSPTRRSRPVNPPMHFPLSIPCAIFPLRPAWIHGSISPPARRRR